LKKEHLPGTEQKFVLIARINGTRIGLIVDKILDEQDVVVKQLPPHMQKAKTIAGAAISSSNTIMLILHIPEILELVKHATQYVQKSQFLEADEGPARILVVDDSVNTGEIEKRILEAYGYQVDLAIDGLNALEQLGKERYDLIVTDIEMPGMDGFSLTERLRTMPHYAEIPIVIVTSLERESDKKRGLQVGANAYITKGNFEQRSLIETVRSLV
jgi:two-component system chemotaxis sensor kinase CheA